LQALALVAERLELPISHFVGGETGFPEVASELLLDDAEAALRSGRPADGLRLVSEAGDIRHLRSRALWLRGWALSDLGRAREAISPLQQALPLAEQSGNERHVVQVLYNLALALASAGNNREALSIFERASALAATMNDPALVGRLTVCIGHLRYLGGEHDEALRQYSRARELFAGVDDIDNLASVYSGLSQIHRQRGDLQPALRYSKMSLSIHEVRHEHWQAAKELSQMAARYGERGDTESALATAVEAVRRAQAAGSSNVEALARSSLAGIYLRLGRLDAARAEAEAAERLRPSEEDIGFGDALVILARVAEAEGNTKRADGLYQRAIEIFQTNGPLSRAADAALAYSEALKARGDLTEALEYAMTAAQTLSPRRT